MESNTALPKWLTPEIISKLKHDIEICPNPYTEEEILALKLDGPRSSSRYNAYVAKEILTKYGIIKKD